MIPMTTSISATVGRTTDARKGLHRALNFELMPLARCARNKAGEPFDPPPLLHTPSTTHPPPGLTRTYRHTAGTVDTTADAGITRGRSFTLSGYLGRSGANRAAAGGGGARSWPNPSDLAAAAACPPERS